MIEVSITEIILFCWAVLATAFALKYKQQERMSKLFVRALIEDEELRDKIVSEVKQHMKEAS
jgi:beta-lactamase regulating signal transducer with metallopeptidase domain